MLSIFSRKFNINENENSYNIIKTSTFSKNSEAKSAKYYYEGGKINHEKTDLILHGKTDGSLTELKKLHKRARDLLYS
jgi:hypothetical protein